MGDFSLPIQFTLLDDAKGRLLFASAQLPHHTTLTFFPMANCLTVHCMGLWTYFPVSFATCDWNEIASIVSYDPQTKTLVYETQTLERKSVAKFWNSTELDVWLKIYFTE